MITFADPDLSFIEKEGQENDHSNRKHRTVPCFHLDGLFHVPGADQDSVQLPAEDSGAGQVTGRVQGSNLHAEE